MLEHTRLQQQKANAQKKRKSARECFAEAKREWKLQDLARLEANRRLREVYQEELAKWQKEKDGAKKEHRKTSYSKPTMGKVAPQIPPPTLASFQDNSDSESDGHEEFELDDIASDGDSDGGSSDA